MPIFFLSNFVLGVAKSDRHASSEHSLSHRLEFGLQVSDLHPNVTSCKVSPTRHQHVHLIGQPKIHMLRLILLNLLRRCVKRCRFMRSNSLLWSVHVSSSNWLAWIGNSEIVSSVENTSDCSKTSALERFINATCALLRPKWWSELHGLGHKPAQRKKFPQQRVGMFHSPAVGRRHSRPCSSSGVMKSRKRAQVHGEKPRT